MGRHRSPRPTDAELSILTVLWRRGASTVREVHEELSREKATGYTTVLKFLQIMTEKDLVTRDESRRSHVYTARHPEESTQQLMVRDLLQRAFSGSMAELFRQALALGTMSAEEADDIRKLLEANQSEQAHVRNSAGV